MQFQQLIWNIRGELGRLWRNSVGMLLRRKDFPVRPIHVLGGWLVDDRRYFENAHSLLAELEEVVAEVNRLWPKPLDQPVKQRETTEAHWDLARKRDLLSDSVNVFSAMSVEAFLNFYGVLRLGPETFNRNFEWLGPVRKLKALLSLCDKIQLTKNDPIVRVLDRIARRRNSLVHPRVREVQGVSRAEDRDGDKIPEVARETVSDMVQFFREFAILVPNAAPHLPPDR